MTLTQRRATALNRFATPARALRSRSRATSRSASRSRATSRSASRSRASLVPMLAVLALALAGCAGQDDAGSPASSASGSPSGGSAGATAGSQPGASAGPASPGASASPSAGPSGQVPPASAGASTGAPASPVTGEKVTGAALAARMGPAVSAAGGRAFTVSGTGAQPITASGVSIGTGSSLNLRVTGDISTMKRLEIIRKGSDVYLKAPSLTQSGRPWLKITDSPKDPYRTLYTTVFSGLATTGDVGAAVAAVGQMKTFVTGSAEVIDGVPCYRYRAAPPAKIAVKIMPQSLQSLDSATLAASSATVELWLDQAGLVHRIASTLVLPKASGSEGTAKSVVSYSTWGTKVTVSPPPAGQIAPPPA